MREYFLADYTGGAFRFFDAAHIAALLLTVALCLFFIAFLRRFTLSQRRAIRVTMAVLLLANEIGYHLWRILTHRWFLETMLPLQLCSVLVWTSATMLLTRSYRLYEFIYFLGIGGATQALLTPDAGIYGFPHYRWFQTFLSHILIVSSAVYMTAVERYRPTWKSLKRAVIALNIYAAFVGLVNALLGSNYLFIARKPDIPTLIDKLAPWPWYVLELEAIALVVLFLLYVPFAIYDWKGGKDRNGQACVDRQSKL